MKAVIALSGLAGFLLFGPPLLHWNHVKHRHVVRVDRDVVARVAYEGQSRCRFEAQRSLTASVSLGELLHVVAGSGSLEVVGVAGLDEVRASARACASHEDFLEELQLTSRMEGRNLYVETEYPDWSDRMGGGERYARLDLRVEVPEGMAADIRDSSGEMALSNLGDVVVDDSSGEIEAYGIQGNIRIDDSSGEITLRDVTGDVEIDDGSGEIDLSAVGGSVVIDDGSGEISVEDVEGSVRVARDGSGGIEVDGVGGDFVVERDGSGSIEFRNVTGRVDVPRKRR
jgi:hypothetical protein